MYHNLKKQQQKKTIVIGCPNSSENKSLIEVRWKSPHTVSISQIYLTFLDVNFLEIYLQIHNAKLKKKNNFS